MWVVGMQTYTKGGGRVTWTRGWKVRTRPFLVGVLYGWSSIIMLKALMLASGETTVRLIIHGQPSFIPVRRFIMLYLTKCWGCRDPWTCNLLPFFAEMIQVRGQRRKRLKEIHQMKVNYSLMWNIKFFLSVLEHCAIIVHVLCKVVIDFIPDGRGCLRRLVCIFFCCPYSVRVKCTGKCC